jgi:drug/metabolite transporter (DMT)-like permease
MSPFGESSHAGVSGGAGRRFRARLWHAPYLLLTLTALFWSGNFVVGRAVHETVPPIALAFWRWTGGLVVVLAVAWPHLRRDLPILLRHWRGLLVVAALGIAGFNTMIYLGLQSTTAINGLLLQSVMPLVILLCSFLLFGERAGPMQLLGVLASLAGVAVIAGSGSWAALAALSLNRGDAWVLAAVVAYALYSVLLRRRPSVHPLGFLAATFAIGVAILLPFYLWEHLRVAQIPASGAAFLAIAYVVIFPSCLAYFFYNRGVELVGANRAGQFVHLLPVFGSILAIVFLGESFHLFHAGGIALIAAGIGLAALGRRRQPISASASGSAAKSSSQASGASVSGGTRR